MTQQRPAAQASRSTDDRSSFDRFVHVAYRQVSTGWFFYVVAGAVLVWAMSAPLWSDAKAWQVALHTGVSIVTVLLLALLENAARRSDEASQEKLNVIAEALAALMTSHSERDPELAPAVERLRVAVGLEERH